MPTTPIEVVGEPQAASEPRLTLVDLIDIALSDPSFSAWVEGRPVEKWINPGVSQWPTPQGGYPQMPPYHRFDGRPIAEIGLWVYHNDVADTYGGGVIIDQETGEILAHRIPSSVIIPTPSGAPATP